MVTNSTAKVRSERKIWRVTTSRVEPNNTDAMGKMMAHWKASPVGRTITSTPANPAARAGAACSAKKIPDSNTS